MNVPLYKINDEYLSFLNDDLLNDELPEEHIAEILECIQSDSVQKSKNVAAFILNSEAEAEKMKAVEDKISKKRRSIEKKIAWLRNYLLFNIQKMGFKELKADDSTFCIKYNEGRYSTRIIDESVIPDNFFKVKKEIMTSEILSELKKGESIPGVELQKRPFITIR